MRGTSKVIMGATIVMVVSLAIVLGLILVLLAELYCSLLLRRRRQHQLPITSSTTATVATTTTNGSAFPAPHPKNQSVPPVTTLDADGVLHAPRSFLFPTIPCKDDTVESHKQYPRLEKKIENQIQPQAQKEKLTVAPATQPSPIPPQPIEEMPRISNTDEHSVHISNPIYDNEARRSSRIDTPFETPDTSPSRLEISGSPSSDEERAKPLSLSSPPMTPPLTPMKKLSVKACSISLRDARSLETSGSDSKGVFSSSSGTPCTSSR